MKIINYSLTGELIDISKVIIHPADHEGLMKDVTELMSEKERKVKTA